MINQKLKNKIKPLVKECVRQIALEESYSSLRKLIREQAQDYLSNHYLTEADKEKKKKKYTMKRNAVMKLLKKDMYDHAPLAYALYNSRDKSEKATARSLFSKKATGTPDDDGQIRQFNDEEINKLYSMLKTK